MRNLYASFLLTCDTNVQVLASSPVFLYGSRNNILVHHESVRNKALQRVLVRIQHKLIL
jgi:hypothetical protein